MDFLCILLHCRKNLAGCLLRLNFSFWLLAYNISVSKKKSLSRYIYRATRAPESVVWFQLLTYIITCQYLVKS
jgi:hypothetical protein